MELKDSVTKENLLRAFAGESQARNRYTFSASLARKKGLHVIEAVFLYTADQEKEHAEIFYDHLKKAGCENVTITGTNYPVDLAEDPAEMLELARNHEMDEFGDVYPASRTRRRRRASPTWPGISGRSRPLRRSMPTASSGLPSSCGRGSSLSATWRPDGSVSTAAMSSRANRPPPSALSATTTRATSSGWSCLPTSGKSRGHMRRVTGPCAANRRRTVIFFAISRGWRRRAGAKNTRNADLGILARIARIG